jgi:hypothetical protein
VSARISKALAASLASQQLGGPKRSRSKFGNVKTVVGEETFDSRREAERWLTLRLLERAGAIAELKRQVRFPLKVNGKLVCTYVADFVYAIDGKLIVEDSKGHRTREYITKAKLFEAVNGFSIREV